MLNQFKHFLLVFILLSGFGQGAYASPKYYQYDGNLPFVEMMLNMMSVMGIIDKVPANYMNQIHSQAYYGQQYRNQYKNLLLRNALLSRRGMNPLSMGRLGLNPMTMGTMGMNPMMMQNPGLNKLGLGSLGLNSMGLKSMGLNSLGMNSLGSTRRSTSPWDNALLSSFPSKSSTNPELWPEEFADEDYLTGKLSRYSTHTSNSPLSRLYRDQNQSFDDDVGNGWSDVRNSNIAQSPCVTEFCGLRPASSASPYSRNTLRTYLDGLWVTDSGEMLGIKQGQFLWSDGESRYLTGTLQTRSDIIMASVDGNGRVLQFQYRLEENRLLTQDPNGLVRTFIRMPVQRQ